MSIAAVTAEDEQVKVAGDDDGRVDGDCGCQDDVVGIPRYWSREGRRYDDMHPQAKLRPGAVMNGPVVVTAWCRTS